MSEDKVRLFSETLARALDRRKFIKSTGNAIVGSLMAVAAGHMTFGKAKADGIAPEGNPVCAPPGPYCNTGGGPLSGCYGGSCFQHLVNGNIVQCRVIYNWYQAGCWTTNVQGGRWTCCDCGCTGGPMCGCAQFSASPPPRPDGPGNGI